MWKWNDELNSIYAQRLYPNDKPENYVTDVKEHIENMKKRFTWYLECLDKIDVDKINKKLEDCKQSHNCSFIINDGTIWKEANNERNN